MTIAIFCLVIAALLPIGCAGISKWGRFTSDFDNHDPRVWLMQQTGYRARANAAQANSWEALIVFAAAVLAAQQLGAPQARVDALAVAFIVTRLVYIGLYVTDRPSWRSLMWLTSFLISIAIFFAAL